MQGIIDFAILLEQADQQQRDKILDQAQQEDSEFVYKVMKKVVFFEELVYLDEGIVAEILSKTSSKVLAYGLHGMPDEFRKSILKLIGHRELRLFKDEEEKMGSKVNPALVLGGQKQILKTARTLEAKNVFVFELISCPRFKQKRAPKEKAEEVSAKAVK